MNNVERLTAKYEKIPRVEDAGPKNGKTSGKAMSRLALRSRLFYAGLCVLGLIPILMRLFGAEVDPRLAAMGFGCFVPGGGFIACGGVVTIAIGLFTTWYLWKKIGMFIQDVYGSFFGIAGFWLIGILGGLLAVPGRGGWLICPETGIPYWGWLLALADAAALWGGYELRLKKAMRQMARARQERIETFDETMRELEEIMAAGAQRPKQRELGTEQLRAMRWLLNASVRETGDFSGFDHIKRPLTDERYQFSTVGYALLLYQAKFAPNFRGYLTQAQRFIIDAFTDPRTCGYWKKTNLIGYLRWDPDPIKRANIMLSGWMLASITGYGAHTQDRRYEEEGALRFRPFAKNQDRCYAYSVQGAVECLYRQYKSKEFPYMLIPCEPHVAFPICNSYGLMGMLIYDRDHGTHYCEDIWDDLYQYFSDNFVEMDGSIALRRQYTYGLRFLPESQMGYDPMADVQNYLTYETIFPGLAKRNYALLRKHVLEVRDGVTYIRGRKWEDIFDMATQSKNPAFIISNLEMLAAEYGDLEVVEGLRQAEKIFLEESRDPRYFRFKDVQMVVMANFVLARLLEQGDWKDLILRGPDATAFTGPLLTECPFPQVLVARAVSDGEDLDLVLYNGEDSGEQEITVEQLEKNTTYRDECSGHVFTSDEEGKAVLRIMLSGRTPVHIVKAS